MSDKKHRPDTVLAHAGLKPETNHGIPNPPVYYASTVLFPTLDAFENRDGMGEFQGVRYGRTGTPTQFAFEEAVTALHGGHKTVSFPSGLAAVTSAMLTFLRNGDHVLIADTVYGPTRARAFGNVLRRAGVEGTFYDPLIGAEIADLIRPNTKVVYMESPGSHTFEMQDVPAICAAAGAKSVLTLIDNTWSSPLFCQPVKLGVDVVIESATKYIVGHSDAMLGTVTVTTEQQFQELKTMANSLGVRAGPDECFLGLRGLRTMGVRLERQMRAGVDMAEWLKARPEVTRVMHPALPDDPGHALWKRDHSGASSLFGAVLDPKYGRSRVEAMLNGLELFGMGASWGGYESLVIPTHPHKNRTATEWTEPGQCLRFHIGLEDPDDLREDLDAGLARLRAA